MHHTTQRLFMLLTFLSLVILCPVTALAQYAIGEVGPDFTLDDLQGNPVQLYDFEGDVIVVNFFATWCPGCNTEATQLQEDIFEAYADQGLTVIAIDLLEPVSTVQPWVEQLGLTYPVLLAPDWSLFQQFPTAGGLPYNAIFDRDMVLQYAQYGFELEAFSEEVEAVLDAGTVDVDRASWSSLKALFR